MAERAVLVTGATGFLGRAVCARLVADGWSVSGLARQPSANGEGVAPIAVDLEDAASAAALRERWRWDAVVHLAGAASKGFQDVREGADLVRAHVRAAATLRSMLPRDRACRVVHASGFIVYGVPERLPVDESAPLRPLHAYALAKVLAEDVWLADARADRDVWILRLPGLFSEARSSGALHHFAAAARRGADIVVDANPLPWDLLHVDDAADAVSRALAARARNPGPINVGHGERIDLAGVARWFAERGAQGSRVLAPAAEVPFQMSIARARELLDWAPPSLMQRLDEYWLRGLSPEVGR